MKGRPPVGKQKRLVRMHPGASAKPVYQKKEENDKESSTCPKGKPAPNRHRGIGRALCKIVSCSQKRGENTNSTRREIGTLF